MTQPDGRKQSPMAVLFIPAVFLSAFLLFQIQPVVSKRILPWFGGAPTVWTTCLLFFQVLLLAGYAFAHWNTTRLPRRAQAGLYVGILVLAALVPVLPGEGWKPEGTASPIPRIIQMLASSVGPAFFALAAAGPTLQAWFARIHPSRSPYHLYAVSNAGSLIALLSYPFLVEPSLSIGSQVRMWWLLFIVFIAVCAAAGGLLWTKAGVRGAAPSQGSVTSRRTDSPRLRAALWVAWPACAVILFMAVTNLLTLNIASAPFLWILPLSIYLLSFIVAFSGARWYPRALYAVLLVASLAVFYVLLPGDVTRRFMVVEVGTMTRIIVSAISLFVCCMVCHGELYRLRPEPERLTKYYLSISFGGAIGGFTVAVVAPYVFLLLQELQLGLLLCAVLYLIMAASEPGSVMRGGRPRWAWGATITGVAAMTATSLWLTNLQLTDTIHMKRNFFGLLRVVESGRSGGEEPHRTIHHGTTIHGMQFLAPRLRRVPTAYYGPGTGLSVVMEAMRRPEGRRVGIVGMGAATTAAYGDSTDYFTFYEIDPDVVHAARTYFTYLSDTPAEWDVQLGDARLRLEEEASQNFDVLVLDAFSSDAIPVHLLTLEAMEIYDRHLKPQGVIAVHITNHHLDLAPVVYHLGESRQFAAATIVNRRRPGGVSLGAKWVVLTRDRALLEQIVEACSPQYTKGYVRIAGVEPAVLREVRPWTDDFSNLLEILE